MFSVQDFYSAAHAKWILAGEHSVVRGLSALVFPLHAKTMTLQYQDNHKPLDADFEGDQGEDLHLLFWSVLEHGLKKIHRDLNHTTGHFALINHIPIGAGLGASGALCSNLSRWFAWKQWIASEDIFEFSRFLEDLFHGKSSGLDIAGSLYDTGLHFKPQGLKAPIIEPIQPKWQPKWYLSFSGHIGMTSHCVKKVMQMHENSPVEGKHWDAQMETSVEKAKNALLSPQAVGLPLLVQAITEAGACFKAWGLLSSDLTSHMQNLLDAGALAAKPTGSGGGGYVLSLWDKKPSLSLGLIAV